MQALVMPAARQQFWYWHLLYWLSYLLLKFTHLAILVPLQNEAVWPYLWVYSLVTLINIVVTGWLGQYYLQQKRSLKQQLLTLSYYLLPLWLGMTVLRQYLIMQYASDMTVTLTSPLRYLMAFSLVLLPLAGWLAVFLLLSASQQHVAGFKQQQELARQARQARLKVLRYQLNPHFMFNTLNALNALIIERNGQSAELLIEHLSTFLRHSLKNQDDSFVTLQQELDALSAYMAIQQVRFGERLTINWQLPETLPRIQCPPLLLQPLAENAVQYSVAEVAGDVSINIRLQQQADMLEIEISQPGTHADDGWHSAQQPAALRDVAERLLLIFGDQATLCLAHSPKGFYSRLLLPVEVLHATD